MYHAGGVVDSPAAREAGRPSLTLRVMIGEGKWITLDGAPSLTLRAAIGEDRWIALDGAVPRSRFGL